MKNLKLKIKLLICFSMVAALAIIVGLVGAFSLKSNDNKYSDAIEFNNTAVSALADMREYFLQQRLAIRGMVIDMQDPGKIQADIDALKSYETAMTDAIAAYESTIIDQTAEKDFYMAKDAYLNGYTAAKQKFSEAVKNNDYTTAMAAVAEATQPAQQVIDGLKKTVDYCTAMIEADSNNLSDNSNMMIMVQVLAMLLAAIGAMVLGLYNASVISKPIKTMSDFFVRFGSTGDLELSEEDQKNIAAKSTDKDEIGQCIGAAVKLVIRISEINENLVKVAGGDLTTDMKVLSEKDTLGLSFSDMVKNLNNMFAEIKLASEQVSSGAGQIAQGSQMLASGSTEQAASIEEFSASLSELERKIHTNAENSANAHGKSNQAGAMMEESIRSMEQMLKAMSDIDESSKSIIKVIKVIDDIAFQTNILALNAAVEAFTYTQLLI